MLFRRYLIIRNSWTLDAGPWTLSLTVVEQNQNPVSDFAWLNYWKFFGYESLRSSWSRLFCRDCRFWRGHFSKFCINVKCYVIPKESFIVRNRITLQAAMLDCSEAAVHSHPFSKISAGNTGVESFFWSNYRLTVQSSDYILKLLHQELFLANLPLGLFRNSCPQPSIFENFSRKYRW